MSATSSVRLEVWDQSSSKESQERTECNEQPCPSKNAQVFLTVTPLTQVTNDQQNITSYLSIVQEIWFLGVSSSMR